MGLRCCGEAQGHMSGEAAIPAFAAQLAVVAEAAFAPFPAPARKALPSPALRCDGVVVTQARRRLRPIRWPIQLDGVYEPGIVLAAPLRLVAGHIAASCGALRGESSAGATPPIQRFCFLLCMYF